MLNTILMWTILSQVWAAAPCPKEQANLMAVHKQVEKGAVTLSDITKQSESLDQRIRDYQKTCTASSDKKCNPAEMQMMAGQSAIVNGQKTKTTEEWAKLKEKEQAAKLALTKCLNEASNKAK